MWECSHERNSANQQNNNESETNGRADSHSGVDNMIEDRERHYQKYISYNTGVNLRAKEL